MSVWTEVEGTVYINKQSKFSFRKYIEDNFQEANFRTIMQKDVGTEDIKVEFRFCFSDSNLEVAKTLQWFVDAIKQHDSKADVDLTATIRFIG